MFGLLGIAVTGCGPNLEQLRLRASHDLSCDEAALVMTPLDEDGDAWGLRGCGKTAAYSYSKDSGQAEWVMTRKPELIDGAGAPVPADPGPSNAAP